MDFKEKFYEFQVENIQGYYTLKQHTGYNTEIRRHMDFFKVCKVAKTISILSKLHNTNCQIIIPYKYSVSAHLSTGLMGDV